MRNIGVKEEKKRNTSPCNMSQMSQLLLFRKARAKVLEAMTAPVEVFIIFLSLDDEMKLQEGGEGLGPVIQLRPLMVHIPALSLASWGTS